jgi:hypothetical protein
MITISSLLNTQTNSFQLILALALTAAAALLAPRDHPHCKERHQENESLMQLAESMQ